MIIYSYNYWCAYDPASDFFFPRSTHSATCFVFCKYLEKRSSKLRLKKNYREREKLGNLVCLHTWKRHMKAQSCVQLLHTNKIKFRNILPRTINLREERRQEAQHWLVLEQMRTTEQKHIEAPLLPLSRGGAPTYEESTSGRGNIRAIWALHLWRCHTLWVARSQTAAERGAGSWFCGPHM